MASQVSWEGSWVYGTAEIRDYKQLVQPSSTSSSFSPFLQYRNLNLDIRYPMDPRAGEWPQGRLHSEDAESKPWVWFLCHVLIFLTFLNPTPLSVKQSESNCTSQGVWRTDKCIWFENCQGMLVDLLVYSGGYVWSKNSTERITLSFWKSPRTGAMVELKWLCCLVCIVFCVTEAKGQPAKFTEHLLR